MKLSLLQISSGLEKRKNLEKVEESISNLDEDSDLAITPEYMMALEDGNLTAEIARDKSETLESNFVRSMRGIAKDFDTALLFTFYRRVENNIFNSAVFLDSNGEIKEVYDKTHLFDALGHTESDIFRRGQEIKFFEWKDLKLGLSMCFDLRFPEIFRIMSFKDVDIVLVPSAFYSGTHKTEQWESLLSARAYENNFFVVGVNQPGPHFVGRSRIYSPLGYVVGTMGEEEGSELMQFEVDEVSKSIREIPIKDIFRKELYSSYYPYD